MNKYYAVDSLPDGPLHIIVGKRKYIEVFRVRCYKRKLKIRNKRKFIKKYKILTNPLLKDDLPFKWNCIRTGEKN